MKKLFLLSITVVLVSCAKKTYQLSDGTFITQKKADRIGMRVIKKEYKKLSKKEKEIFQTIEIDTSNINN